MDPLIKLAKENDIWVLEDCAQAHFANYNGKIVGTFGDAATFSFILEKILVLWEMPVVSLQTEKMSVNFQNSLQDTGEGGTYN